MAVVKVGINGFGRIGRLVTRALLENENKIDIVGINDLSSTKMLGHLFEYDATTNDIEILKRADKIHLLWNGKIRGTYEDYKSFRKDLAKN